MIKTSEALEILDIDSYLLYSNMFKLIGEVPSMWLDGRYGGSITCIIANFLGCDYELLHGANRKKLYVISMLFISSHWWLHIPTVALHHVSFHAFSLLGSIHNKCTFIFWSCETENPKYIFQVWYELKCRREEVSNLHEVFHFHTDVPNWQKTKKLNYICFTKKFPHL